MNNDDSGFTDPFAKMDDGFGDGDQFGMADDPAISDHGYGQDDSPDNAGQYAGEDDDQYEAPLGYTESAQPAAAAAVQNAPKPFLKTPIGMMSAGAGVLMLGLVGFVGIKSMGGPSQTLTEAPARASVAPPPVAGDLHFNANTLPTQSATAIATELKPIVRPALPVVQSAPAATVAATSAAALPGSEGNQPQEGLGKLQSSALEETPTISTADEVARLKATVNHLRDESAEIKTTVASLSQGLNKLSGYAEKDHAEQTEIKDKLDALIKRMDEAPKAAETAAVNASKADAGKVAPAKVAEVGNPKAPGRFRLPGLKVVEATESGKMAVVTKLSNGRTFTLFKGERLGTPRGNMSVTEVKDEGFLVLVGDQYYIDKVSEDKPEAPVVAAAPRAEKPSRKSSAAAKPKPAEVTETGAYTLNAVSDGGSSFGIVNNNGEFKLYRLGDELPGAGKITGLDGNGDLKAGNKVIKSLY
jgi:soluble cytochrome b562